MATIQVDQQALSRFLEANATVLTREPAERVKARQEQLCPRDTASNRHMADNIAIDYHDGYADIGPTARFFYARMVEIGGATNRRPKPFIRPSATG